MGFRVGHSKIGGRTRGTPNKRTVEVQQFAIEFVLDPVYRKNLRQRLQQGKAQQLEVLLWHYAFGKPKEEVEQVDESRLIAQRTIEQSAVNFESRMARLSARQGTPGVSPEPGRNGKVPLRV